MQLKESHGVVTTETERGTQGAGSLDRESQDSHCCEFAIVVAVVTDLNKQMRLYPCPETGSRIDYNAVHCSAHLHELPDRVGRRERMHWKWTSCVCVRCSPASWMNIELTSVWRGGGFIRVHYKTVLNWILWNKRGLLGYYDWLEWADVAEQGGRSRPDRLKPGYDCLKRKAVRPWRRRGVGWIMPEILYYIPPSPVCASSLLLSLSLPSPCHPLVSRHTVQRPPLVVVCGDRSRKSASR